MRLACLALLVAGCGSSAPLPIDCSTVGNGIHKYWAGRAAETTDPEELAAIADTARTSAAKFEKHCREDRWSTEMIACARTVFRIDDSGCKKFMSQQQRIRFTSVDSAPIEGGVGIGR